jgi:ATP-binding cassette subfamily B protein
MRVTNLAVLKKMWSYAREYRWAFFSILVLITFVGILGIIIPFFYKQLFDGIASGDFSPQAVHALYGTLIGLLLYSGLQWFLYRINGFLLVWYESAAIEAIDRGSFADILRHSYGFFSNSFAGTLTRRVKRFSDAFERLNDTLFFNIIPLVITVCGSLIVLWLRDFRLGLGMLVSAAVVIAANLLFSRWKFKYDTARSERDSEVSGSMTDTFSNNVNVKTFAREDFEKTRFGGIRNALTRAQRVSWNLMEASMAVQAVAMLGMEIAILWIAVGLWRKGVLTVGDFALIQAYLIAFFERVWNVGRVMRHIYEGLADAQEMVEISERTPDVRDMRRAQPLEIKNAAILYSDVTFHYHKTRKTIDRFTLKIEPGERAAFVGPSGAGKSTLAKLLLRFYDPSAGRISIDGQDIKRVTQESLRSQISFVPQDPVLFHRTIEENILYARPDASKQDVERAARLAHSHEFIVDLPDGYGTYVGERGIKLSGGERQRIALTRAILKNAPILLLDEATSSLDSESEALIQDALARLMKGRTTIAIAHRLSTIMQMDRIIVLLDGRIADQGTHKELLARPAGGAAGKGLYRNLWNIQAGGFIR